MGRPRGSRSRSWSRRERWRIMTRIRRKGLMRGKLCWGRFSGVRRMTPRSWTMRRMIGPPRKAIFTSAAKKEGKTFGIATMTRTNCQSAGLSSSTTWSRAGPSQATARRNTRAFMLILNRFNRSVIKAILIRIGSRGIWLSRLGTLCLRWTLSDVVPTRGFEMYNQFLDLFSKYLISI